MLFYGQEHHSFCDYCHQQIFGFLGVAVGFWIGYLNAELLFKDALKSAELEMKQALRRMQGVSSFGWVSLH